MSDKTGGPAFPSKREHTTKEGMTLRDYFAAKAMQGELASMYDPEQEICGLALDISDAHLDRMTKHFYRIADSMLKARER